jgi:hypothetical protein
MEKLNGWDFYFLSILALMIIGYYLITHIIFQSFEIKRKKPILVFTSVFSLSIMLLEMFIIEILKVGTNE